MLVYKHLPGELNEHILNYVYPNMAVRNTAAVSRTRHAGSGRSAAYTPPEDGSSPFMKLPTELRRTIFAESLPAKDVLIPAECNDDSEEGDNQEGKKRIFYGSSNRTADLMTLNKTICEEIAEVVYDERCFVIHVHEGLQDGGIEFLNAGRQPLQFQDNTSDGRFWKFSDKEGEFGFKRLKKIRVQIYPSKEANTKHSAINTYFMNLALVQLLDRGTKDEDRITSLTVEFMKPEPATETQGRTAILRAEQYWWDPDKERPRETSIHGIPNIELVLRPFANLIGCHAVNVEMPTKLAENDHVAKFVEDLKTSMMSKTGRLLENKEFTMNIEAARYAMEEYVYSLKHGTKHREVAKLALHEFDEDKPTDSDDDDDENDGTPPKKRGLSPTSKAWSPGSDSKRAKSAEAESTDQDDVDADEDEDFARAVKESKWTTEKEKEQRQYERAIAESMTDVDDTQDELPRQSWAERVNSQGRRSGAVRQFSLLRENGTLEPIANGGPVRPAPSVEGRSESIRAWNTFAENASTAPDTTSAFSPSPWTPRNTPALRGGGRAPGSTLSSDATLDERRSATNDFLDRMDKSSASPWTMLPSSLSAFYRKKTGIQKPETYEVQPPSTRSSNMNTWGSWDYFPPARYSYGNNLRPRSVRRATPKSSPLSHSNTDTPQGPQATRSSPRDVDRWLIDQGFRTRLPVDPATQVSTNRLNGGIDKLRVNSGNAANGVGELHDAVQESENADGGPGGAAGQDTRLRGYEADDDGDVSEL